MNIHHTPAVSHDVAHAPAVPTETGLPVSSALSEEEALALHRQNRRALAEFVGSVDLGDELVWSNFLDKVRSQKASERTAQELSLVKQAQEELATDECEIDDDALVSVGDDGAFVAAWVWVPIPDADAESDADDA